MKHAIAGCLTLMLLAGVTVKSATAMPAWDEYGLSTDGGGDGGPVCGSGTKTLCRIDNTSTCVDWQFTSGTGSVTASCTTVVSVVKNYYFP